MKSQVKPLRSPRGQKLVELCKKIMVAAARDLAEFTQYGLNASFIVSLAMTCEAFENAAKPGPPATNADLPSLEDEIRKGVLALSEAGQSIWNPHSPKHQDYLLPAPIHEGLTSGTTSANVA